MHKLLKPYYLSARDLHLSVRYLADIDCLQIKLGKKIYLFSLGATPFNNHGSIYLAKNKPVCQWMLKQSSFPVLNGVLLEPPQENIENLLQKQKLTFPLVIKPAANTFGGEGVQCDIKNSQQLKRCLEDSLQKYPKLYLEEFKQGMKEYRILILKNRILGIVERKACSLIGDGKQSIEELYQHLKNKNQSSTIDERCIENQGFAMNSIPHVGQKIRLVYPVNRSLGGSSHSLPLKKIPRRNKQMLLKIAHLLHLELVGLDILCIDIKKEFRPGSWYVLEANFGPGLNMHEQPTTGKKSRVSKKILWALIRRHPYSYLKRRLIMLFAQEKSV